jgi:hypothetical protein
LHSFTEDFQKCLEEHLKLMNRNGNRRFDEYAMGEIIADHLYNSGYNNAEIMSLIQEMSVFEEDDRDFYELCGLLIRMMVEINESGLNYPTEK